jgi:hypothetical protein
MFITHRQFWSGRQSGHWAWIFALCVLLDCERFSVNSEAHLSLHSANDSEFRKAGTRRPPVHDRRFTSQAVESLILNYIARMKCPVLADLFANCLPNTLDTTVHLMEVGADDPNNQYGK